MSVGDKVEFCRVCGTRYAADHPDRPFWLQSADGPVSLPREPLACLCRVPWDEGRRAGTVIVSSPKHWDWAMEQACARLNRRLLGLPEVPEETEGVSVWDDGPDAVAQRAAAFRMAMDGERPIVDRAARARPAKGAPVAGQLRLKLPLYSVRRNRPGDE